MLYKPFFHHYPKITFTSTLISIQQNTEQQNNVVSGKLYRYVVACGVPGRNAYKSKRNTAPCLHFLAAIGGSLLTVNYTLDYVTKNLVEKNFAYPY